uniref:Putative pheromone Mr_Ph1 n=1 Tax=Moniliophthora roreri TaxID=221103 RepID=A0A0W0FBQ5_MONRR
MDSFSTLDTLLHLEEEEAFTTPAYDGEQSTIPVNEERPGTGIQTAYCVIS